jgi:hypothetical protein
MMRMTATQGQDLAVHAPLTGEQGYQHARFTTVAGACRLQRALQIHERKDTSSSMAGLGDRG